MPQRFLRPGLTTSKRWNCLTWISQSFYVRLLTLVDDFGRYDAAPRLLRSHCFPLGDAAGRDMPLSVIEKICQEISVAGMVQFYETDDGHDVLQILRWQERPRAQSSRYQPFNDGCKHLFSDCEQMLPSLVPRSSPSSSPLATSHRHSTGGSAEQNAPVPANIEKDWREKLAADPAYGHIRVSDEFSKMLRWCEVNKKQPTRRRFINWLNRIEKPLKAFPGSRKAGSAKSSSSPSAEDDEQFSQAAIIERQRQVRELSETLYPQMSAAKGGASA